jgi:hypothetical protein
VSNEHHSIDTYLYILRQLDWELDKAQVSPAYFCIQVDADGIVCSKKQGSSSILRKENFQIQQTLMLLR